METADRLVVMSPTNRVPGPPQGRWTYEDYAALPEDGKRYEVVNGVLYIAPSPNWWHQRAVLRIGSSLLNFVEAKGLGKVCIAPFDVRLSPRDIVQPDVFVVLNVNLNRLTDACLIEAPDLVVEVASPSTAGHDRREKQDAYARAGVPEYWIVNAEARTVELLVQERGDYRSLGLFLGKAQLPSQVLPAFPIAVEQFFP